MLKHCKSIIMKRIYVTPNASVEEFVANEYVAGCYGRWAVACDYDAANNVEKNVYGTYSATPSGNQVNHGAAGCGTSSKQYVEVVDDVVKSMKEVNTGVGQDLPCTVYTDGTYSTKADISEIKAGDYIYWTTSASGDRVWHHQGLVSGTLSGRPNHS